MSTGVTRLRLAFCSGGLAGQVVVTSTARLHVGRSADNDISLTEQDITVSGRHAVLEFQNSSWLLGDAGSHTGTFVNGRRLGPGDRAPLQPGDWILFGAGGAAALVLASNAAAPHTWIVLAPEDDPAGYLALTDTADVSVAVSDSGGLDFPAPARAQNGYRFRLDRTPVSAVTLDATDGESAVAVEIGDVLKLAPDHAGIRILGMQGGSSAAPVGETMLRRAIHKEIGRRRALPYLLVALVVVAAVATTLYLLDVADRRHQQEQLRVERDRMRLEQELDVLQDELVRRLSSQQEEFDTVLTSQREKFDAALKLQQEETQRKLEELAVSDRDKFAKVLEEYRGSVLLILIRVRFRSEDRVVFQTAACGTGWVVRDDGLVVTNKHVVQPWKFKLQLQAMLLKHPELRIESDIYAWPSGQRFLDANNQPPNETTGFNTTHLKNVTLLGTAPDDWISVKTEFEGANVTCRIHAHTDGDLALLQLTGGTFTPIPVKADPTTMKELDSVMLLGFPLGQRVLDSGRADLSASLGTIRFVSGVVNHTASGFPGNSGGPLMSLDGEVIGVLTRSPIVERATSTSAETMSMAIRSDSVLRFLEPYQ